MSAEQLTATAEKLEALKRQRDLTLDALQECRRMADEIGFDFYAAATTEAIAHFIGIRAIEAERAKATGEQA